MLRRPVVTVDSGSIERFVEASTVAAGRRAAALMDQIGQEMVQECVRIVQTELPTGQRHKPNTTHLDQSFTYRVERGSGRGGFPYTVHLTIKPGVSKGKIAALNYGVEPKPTYYVIRPGRNAPRALRFSDQTNWNRTGGKYPGQVLSAHAVRTMTSGPREGKFFMERARDTVMARHGFTRE